jgi:hypothetical protein
VARILPTLLVLALLGCTATALAVTEGLKLEKSPIGPTKVDKVIAPSSAANAKAYVDFVLRKRDHASVVIVDANGDVVRSLGTTRRARVGKLSFVWDGRDEDGRIVPDGTYKPRVHLSREHRTIVLPNPIRVDAKAPSIRLVSVRPRVFSPDGDFVHEFIRLRYVTSEPAQAFFYLDGNFRVQVRRFVRSGKLDWGGKSARRLPAGTYSVRLRAVDRAGNFSQPTRAVVVRIRYIDLRPHVLHVRTGKRFSVRVRTDAKRYSWHLGSRGKLARKRVLTLRAGAPGSYRLVVAANGHVARALVVVTP